MTPLQRWMPIVVLFATFALSFVFYKLYPTMPGFWQAASAMLILAFSFWSLVLIAKRAGVANPRRN